MQDEVKLNEEEVKVIETYQEAIRRDKTALGNLRIQFLTAEKQVLQRVEKAESDFISHIKVLSQSKGILQGESEWFFDPSTFAFRKKQ